MGREVLRAVYHAEDCNLVAAVDPVHAGSDAGELAGLGPIGLPVVGTLQTAFQHVEGAAYVVDFTTPAVVYRNVLDSIEAGHRVVFGTTGLSDAQLEDIDKAARAQDLGVIHAPNFAIGAVLMMKFAAEAARHFDGVEIIELHHDQKKDAPSGTAIKTAEMIRDNRRSDQAKKTEKTHEIEGARGANIFDIPVHSVRLPGLVAHQEVILGLPGQTLTIRHDSFDRASFMPGVLLALRKVDEVKGLLYGLEHLL